MQTEYFILESAASNDHPMLSWDEHIVGFGRPQPASFTRPLQLRLGAPVPRNPIMVDHHELPEPVVSPRLKDALEALGLHGVQFVAADVKVKPDDVRCYWIIRIFNLLACMDRQLSKFSLSRRGRVNGIDKLVLDERVLRDIPLERRLVFRLVESSSTNVFHQSVSEKVLALQPEGLRFIRVDKWNDSAGFEP